MYKNKKQLKTKNKENEYISNTMTDVNGISHNISRHQIVGQYFHSDTLEEGKSIDHINRITYDNRAENIRWANSKTQSINKQHKKYYKVSLNYFYKMCKNVNNESVFLSFINGIYDENDFVMKNSIIYVRVPTNFDKTDLKSEKDKIVCMLYILLFTYGRKWNKLKFKPSEIKNMFDLEDMNVKELMEYLLGDYENIKIEYFRTEGFVITPILNEKVDEINDNDCESNTKNIKKEDLKEKINHNRMTFIMERMNYLRIHNPLEYQKDNEWRNLKKEYDDMTRVDYNSMFAF